jgi:hypothetical protein
MLDELRRLQEVTEFVHEVICYAASRAFTYHEDPSMWKLLRHPKTSAEYGSENINILLRALNQCPELAAVVQTDINKGIALCEADLIERCLGRVSS